MSTAISYLEASISGQQALLNEVPSKRKMRECINVIPDYKRSTFWIKIRRNSHPFISLSFLNEVLDICKAQKGLPSAPFRYRVLASEIPKTFSLGGDLEFFVRCIRNRDPQALTRYALKAVNAVYENSSGSGYSDLCSIALIQGEAQGGGFEAALSSHVIVAERGANFGFPEGLFGMYPGMGARALLEKRIGNSEAKQLIGSARRWSAEELHDMGVVDVLANNGEGELAVENFIRSTPEHAVERLKDRVSNISLSALQQDVLVWVEQAQNLTHKNVKTMEFLLSAQRKSIPLRKSIAA